MNIEEQKIHNKGIIDGVLNTRLGELLISEILESKEL